MEFLSLAAVDRIGAAAIVTIIAILVITDKLVWHSRLKASEARADRWETIALEALHTGTQAGVRAAEVATDVLSKMPDPAAERKV